MTHAPERRKKNGEREDFEVTLTPLSFYHILVKKCYSIIPICFATLKEAVVFYSRYFLVQCMLYLLRLFLQ